ncbi:hypothetical protein CBR_g40625 [Chara braunii]|uniref:Integrase catalytic domain-containing protein n=1 Tax=Chara braunii TaxID=69332 RepID=A0A388LU73_CHABU|nr:hypothetical protein CBR_g40625 [Chara braunii]|eukprot:GBG85815.1 hypothetical protein CBR_g40625 [Chara braunii]
MDTTDIVVPPGPNSCEYSILLVFLEHFSKWIEAYPCKTRQAAEIVRYVNRFLGMHQDSEEIRTDNGAEFRGEVFRNLVLHGVSIHNTAPHMSQSKGLVENANRVIKTALRHNIAANDTRPWPDIMDHILAIHQGTPHDLCLLGVAFHWAEPADRGVADEIPDDEVELLLIQGWRTDTEGDFLGIVFGEVRNGHLSSITNELLVFLTQVLDDLPLEILSHCDERPGTATLTHTLERHLLWSTCTELEGGSYYVPSAGAYLHVDVTDLSTRDPLIRRVPVGETSEEEEEDDEEEASAEEEDRESDPDYQGSENAESKEASSGRAESGEED